MKSFANHLSILHNGQDLGRFNRHNGQQISEQGASNKQSDSRLNKTRSQTEFLSTVSDGKMGTDQSKQVAGVGDIAEGVEQQSPCFVAESMELQSGDTPPVNTVTVHQEHNKNSATILGKPPGSEMYVKECKISGVGTSNLLQIEENNEAQMEEIAAMEPTVKIRAEFTNEIGAATHEKQEKTVAKDLPTIARDGFTTPENKKGRTTVNATTTKTSSWAESAEEEEEQAKAIKQLKVSKVSEYAKKKIE
ncbi:hypothetical protein LIER_35583 [Lithospermum erythrorhizon]|uniref:Uncharacterized protein n=1 Tax=Lithospermum erythrorhizon TaxID=34254 RepID=A0AAV3NWW9_LITER